MTQPHSPRVRLVTKPIKAETPVAQEPPESAPTAAEAKAPKVKDPEKSKQRLQKAQLKAKQSRKEVALQAELLMSQNPGLNLNRAYEVLRGQYTVEEVLRRHQAKVEKKLKSKKEKSWCSRFFKGPEREPIWMETARGDLITRVLSVTKFSLTVQSGDDSENLYEKTEISALCSADLATQIQEMRQVELGAQRDIVPAYKRLERWAFPEETFDLWVDRQVRIQLLNGSTWTGFLRWNSLYTFLLGAQATGEQEVLIFKHSCCDVQLIP